MAKRTCTVVQDGIRCERPHLARGMCGMHYQRWLPTVDRAVVRRLGEAAADRFLRKVNRTATPDGCWLWTGSRSTEGYGMISITAKPKVGRGAHVFALEMALGRRLRPNMWALHTCDVRGCVRNEPPGLYELNGILRPCHGHLFEGTVQDNVDDCTAKGGYANRHVWLPKPGEECHFAKLTDAEVLAIREADDGIPRSGKRTELALQYNISQRTIRDIVNRRTWRHL